MSTTQSRLDLYLAAEARILKAGLSSSLRERSRQEADLASIRKAITALQTQLAAEQAGRGSSAGSLRYRTAVFS